MVGLAAMRKLCRPPVLILLGAALLLNVAVADGRRTTSRVRIGMDGGYSDILVEVSEHLPRTSCRTILANLKVRVYRLHLPPWICIWSYIVNSQIIKLAGNLKRAREPICFWKFCAYYMSQKSICIHSYSYTLALYFTVHKFIFASYFGSLTWVGEVRKTDKTSKITCEKSHIIFVRVFYYPMSAGCHDYYCICVCIWVYIVHIYRKKIMNGGGGGGGR